MTQKNNNFEHIRDLIGQECVDFGITEGEDLELLGRLLDLTSESYVLITFPDVQDYMEEKWFNDEAVLDNSDNAEPSSYFIPLVRIL